jgi:arylsulfatase
MKFKARKLKNVAGSLFRLPAFFTMIDHAPRNKKNQQPNILIDWGDDIGQSNIGTCTNVIMGYLTPNIDRIVNEGLIFSNYYMKPSSSAGRSSFTTGQSISVPACPT